MVVLVVFDAFFCCIGGENFLTRESFGGCVFVVVLPIVGVTLFDWFEHDFGAVAISAIKLSVDIQASVNLFGCCFFLPTAVVELECSDGCGVFFFLGSVSESVDKPMSGSFCFIDGDSGRVIPQLLLAVAGSFLPVNLPEVLVASARLSDESALTSFLIVNLIFARGFLSIARFMAGLDVREESDDEMIIFLLC